MLIGLVKMTYFHQLFRTIDGVLRLVRPILTRMDTDGHPEVDTEGQLWTQIDLNAHTPHAILSSALLTAR